jgi:prolyl 4-hydroxylase
MQSAWLDLSQPLFWTIGGVLAPPECQALIERIDAAGPVIAPVSLPGGPVVRRDLRDNERVVFDDAALAADLFGRLRARLPAELSGRRLVGVNERFRCYRYRAGQRFGPHYDGAFVRDERERSLLTLMVYLNEGFEGGATTFLELERAVTPRTGRALLFQHSLLHEGSVVRHGVKYVARSDVMYRDPG